MRIGVGTTHSCLSHDVTCHGMRVPVHRPFQSMSESGQAGDVGSVATARHEWEERVVLREDREGRVLSGKNGEQWEEDERQDWEEHMGWDCGRKNGAWGEEDATTAREEWEEETATAGGARGGAAGS